MLVWVISYVKEAYSTKIKLYFKIYKLREENFVSLFIFRGDEYEEIWKSKLDCMKSLGSLKDKEVKDGSN
ncbi:hypothetical protein BK784_35820 [Bacillus thuringiensis serovar medellin]|uniref:Uncharacterized protein n=1 Tax=Bacillus thuringiensis subsp. medellin TaxID=79672 RepID=A0A9X6MS48_BACTV|nr:hypothetical protein BK784_35820 [Bacillus thuringiensis serovar medellin]